MDATRVRAMREDEMGWAVRAAEKEGWNPGLEDGGVFFATDPEGFFVAERNGQVAGTLAGVRYGEGFGFMGLYIVEEGLRKRGIGVAMWAEAVRHLGDRNVGLDGVMEQTDNYRRSGFELAYHNVRYAGAARRMGGGGEGVVDGMGVPLAALAAYDARHFPAERAGFVDRWRSNRGTRSRVVLGADGGIEGWGVLRPCVVGYKVGPLFAESVDRAEALLGGLLEGLEGAPFSIDVPEPNGAAVEMARKLGLEPVFQTARMYNKGEPGLPLGEIFGVTTLELG